MSAVFQIREDVWWACWRGLLAHADFNSKGAAQAWVDGCEKKGRWRA